MGWLPLGASPLASPGDLELPLASQGLLLQPLAAEAEIAQVPLDALVVDAGHNDGAAAALVGRLQASPLARRIVVCMVSPDMNTINRLVAAGAADVMPAPITPDGLTRRLQRLLRRRR